MKVLRQVWRTGTYTKVRDKKAGANAKPKGTTRAKKGFPTRPEQVTANDKAAARNLDEIISGNFRYRDGDLWVCLTVDPEHLCTLDELTHRVKLFIRALARQMKKEGRALKWLIAPADMDGDTGETVRVHCHVIMSRADVELLRRLWRYGAVDVRTIHRKDSQMALALYIIKQARHLPNAKKWSCSRNLARPRLVREYWADSAEAYRLPNGARPAAIEWAPEEGKLLYLTYQKPEQK